LVVAGRRPVVKDMRDGEQTVCWQKALSNTVPESASFCKCGVFMKGVEYMERSARRSSNTR
jgi:hypothetical protein